MHDPTQATRRCRKYLAEYARERTDYVREYKTASGCVDCGYNAHPAALEFDHRPDEVKVADVGQLRFSGTWQQFLDEIAKCDVVCANCHRIRTHSRPPAMQLHDLRDKTAGEAVSGYRPAPDPDQLGLFGESA